MARKIFEAAPEFNVHSDSVVIQQVPGSSSNLFEIKAHDGSTLMSIDDSGIMSSSADSTMRDLQYRSLMEVN